MKNIRVGKATIVWCDIMSAWALPGNLFTTSKKHATEWACRMDIAIRQAENNENDNCKWRLA